MDLKFQEVLYLKFYEGLSIPEISEQILIRQVFSTT